MLPPANGVKPVAEKQRIQVLDILRGVAVFGILAINIGNIALPWQAASNPTLYSNGTDLEYWVHFFTKLIFGGGKMRGLFSLLFGAGMILFISRAEARMEGMAPAELFYRRLIWLIIFGLLHGYLLLYPGDILFTYGIVGMFLLPFRKLKPRALLAFAGSILVLLTIGIYIFGLGTKATYDEYAEVAEKEKSGLALTEDDLDTKEAWMDEIEHLQPNPAEIQEVIEDKQSGYLDLFGDTAEETFSGQTEQLLQLAFWDTILMMLVGLALMKMGFLQYHFKMRTYLITLAVAYAIWLSLDLPIINQEINNYQNVVMVQQYNTWYQIARVAGTIGHLCLIMLLTRLPIMGWLGTALANVGRMALTNYILQTAICITIFYGFGFGLFGQLLRIELYYVIFGTWAFQMVLSTVWLRYFRFGPLEWLWRCLTYWEIQPLLKRKKTMGKLQPVSAG